MAEVRPLVLVVDPGDARPVGPYSRVAVAGRQVLAAELRERLSTAGVAVASLAPTQPAAGQAFHWGRWFTAAARAAIEGVAEGATNGGICSVGYAGAGALALADDDLLDALAAPSPGEVVANNRYSADAFVVRDEDGGPRTIEAALAALSRSATDNAAVRCLEEAGFGWRDLSSRSWSRFDVDTPLDLALLRLATRLPTVRRVGAAVSELLETAVLPGDRRLDVPHLDAVGEVVRDRDAQLVVAGRVPASALAYLETESACRVRAYVEERGMRSAPEAVPRSLLADWVGRLGADDLVDELAGLGDAVILDSRVVMASLARSSQAPAWPPEEERFASDFADATAIETAWLRELTSAAEEAPVPFLLGGHALVSDGLRILVDAAWLGH